MNKLLKLWFVRSLNIHIWSNSLFSKCRKLASWLLADCYRLINCNSQGPKAEFVMGLKTSFISLQKTKYIHTNNQFRNKYEIFIFSFSYVTRMHIDTIFRPCWKFCFWTMMSTFMCRHLRTISIYILNLRESYLCWKIRPFVFHSQTDSSRKTYQQTGLRYPFPRCTVPYNHKMAMSTECRFVNCTEIIPVCRFVYLHKVT